MRQRDRHIDRRHRLARRHRRPWAGLILPAALLIGSVTLGFLIATVTGVTPVPAFRSAAQNPVLPEPAPAATVPSAVLPDCAVAIERGEAAVVAATTAHRNWSGHVQAQLDYDAGRTTREQTKQTWAETKATAEADVADFRAARQRFDEETGRCGTVVVGGIAVEWCADRLTGLDDGLRIGDGVVDEWARHIEMMSNKKDMAPGDYGQMWREMVIAAPVNLDAFTASAERLDGLPACPVA